MAWPCRSVGIGADMESWRTLLDDRLEEDGTRAPLFSLSLAVRFRKVTSSSEGNPEQRRLFLTQRRHAGIASSHCEQISYDTIRSQPCLLSNVYLDFASLTLLTASTGSTDVWHD